VLNATPISPIFFIIPAVVFKGCTPLENQTNWSLTLRGAEASFHKLSIPDPLQILESPNRLYNVGKKQ